MLVTVIMPGPGGTELSVNIFVSDTLVTASHYGTGDVKGE